MNKQAFTFLTLFTLVVLLGVYNVTLPADSITIEPDQLITSIEENVIEQYNELKQQKNEETMNQNEQVISNGTTTSEEKLEALQENTVLQGIVLFEQNVESILKENGYEECFVEKNNEILRVVLPESEKSHETAVKVIGLIDLICDEDVLIEVSFE